MFNRPPPPYPGQGPVRGPVRFPGHFPGDQRVCFPNDGQMHQTPHPGDLHLRQQGPRFVLQFFVIPLCCKCSLKQSLSLTLCIFLFIICLGFHLQLVFQDLMGVKSSFTGESTQCRMYLLK